MCRTIDGIPQYDHYPDPGLTDCGVQRSRAIGPLILDAITKSKGAAVAAAAATGTPSNESTASTAGTAGEGSTVYRPANGGSTTVVRPPSPPMSVIMSSELIRSMETALLSFPGLDVHPIPNVATAAAGPANAPLPWSAQVSPVTGTGSIRLQGVGLHTGSTVSCFPLVHVRVDFNQREPPLILTIQSDYVNT